MVEAGERRRLFRSSDGLRRSCRLRRADPAYAKGLMRLPPAASGAGLRLQISPQAVRIAAPLARRRQGGLKQKRHCVDYPNLLNFSPFRESPGRFCCGAMMPDRLRPAVAHWVGDYQVKLAKTLRRAAVLAILGAAQACRGIVDWTLSNGTFDDGGTFSGTFTVDTTTDTITDWNVTTSGASYVAACLPVLQLGQRQRRHPSFSPRSCSSGQSST
jgi:hypothetical protein